MATTREKTKLQGSPAFAKAVEVARHFIPIQKRVTRPEALSDYTIVRKTGHSGEHFEVYQTSAWSEPTTAPLLAWSAPTGEKVATVDLDGEVTIL
jgi:hypothetical protein